MSFILSCLYVSLLFTPVQCKRNTRALARWQGCTKHAGEKIELLKHKSKPKSNCAMTVQWPGWPWCSGHMSRQASLFNYYYTSAPLSFGFFFKCRQGLCV